MATLLKEITMTLFNNKPGYVLSVTPNYNYGGRRINFSFKGDNTLSLKAVKDLTTADPTVATMIREMLARQTFAEIYSTREKCQVMRFSKGYLSTGSGHKGPTVPAIGAIWYTENRWSIYLDFYQYQYATDDLSEDVLTAQQRAGKAIAGHRWRKPVADAVIDTNNIFDFLGEADG